MKKKGREREGERKGEGEEKEKGKGRTKKKIRVQKQVKEEKNMWGKEMKKMDKGTNAKELRNFGISLIIHDRRLSGVYILI